MESKISRIRKRDGTIVGFDQGKITAAIFKAAQSVGGKDRKHAQMLSDKVAKELENIGNVPSVEQIQDIVEKALIEEGHAATAKAYILYRQQRAAIRKEKQLVLEKEDIDEVDKRFDVNALRVLKARYLRKDSTGKLTETPKQLFTRVAVHAALPDLFYDTRLFDISSQQPVNMIEDFKPAVHEEQHGIGMYKLNRYHLEALKRMYDRFNRNKQMKVTWSKFFDMIKKGELDSYQSSIDELYNLMTKKLFMPNTPAIANFGNPLGMGSACFHPNQPIMTANGPKEIKDVNVGDFVLTHKGRFRRVDKVHIRNTSSLYKVSCSKLPKPSMLVTEEHPILSYKDDKIQWMQLNMLNEGDYVALAYPKEVEDVEAIEVSSFVQNVKVNEKGECAYEYKGGKFNAFVHTTKPVRNTIPVDYELMKLFGYYLSEGSIADSDCLRFTFSNDEEVYCNDVISIVEKKFGVSARIERTNKETRKWLSLRFHSTILARFFENILGKGFSKKQIPQWILKLPQDKQKGLMAGIIRGDGTIFKNSNKTNARLVMCNQNAVYAFWQMAMRCGVFPALGKESMPKLGTTQPYRCTISGENGLLLINELFDRQEVDSGYKPNTIVADGITFTEIDEISKIDYFGSVYNLEVEEDHSYVANMVSVHNCFVLDVPDSIEGIMETLKNTAVVFKAGGGMGYNFSKLRPEGDFVSSTGGVASGPLSFMRLFDTMTEVIKQGGIRSGANMGILNSNHPDIEKFITAKDGNKSLRNFNISVLIMPDFWEHYENNTPYPLVNPKDGTIVKTVNPRVLFDKIVYQAWESAEPGVIFFDKVNEYNPFYEHLGPIVTTNPCVAGDTLVSTENGLERIDSMKTKSIIVDVRTETTAKNLLMLQKGCKKVEAMQVVKTGIKDAYRLTTKSGYELIATADHKVLTDNGWKEIRELTEHDSVLLQSGQGNFNKNPEIPFEVNNFIIGENGRNYKLNLPAEWSKELGLVLGWLTGDGWISEKYNSMGFVFAPEDSEIKNIIKPILERYFNRKIEEQKYENGCVQIRSASKYVIEYFKKIGVSENRSVPFSLFTATEDSVVGFLQGLFGADGSIGLGRESRNYIRLNSSSIKLLKDVQLLLLNLGIRGSIYDRSTKPKEFKYTNTKGELIIYRTSGTNYELNISKENIPRFIEKIGFMHSKFKEKASKLNKFQFYEEHFLDSINFIEYIGKKEVYDITERSTHSFIANGIIVHNCGEVLLYPNEPCNLGSINVWAFAKQDEEGNTYVDWVSLKDVVRSCTRFLDNVIDVNNFPLKAIEEMSLATRKIGLGVMGVGDLLYELRLPYDSEEGRKFMEQLMEFIAYWSKAESIELAKARGNLPYYSKSFYKEGKLPIRGAYLRNEWHFDWDKMGMDIKKYGIRNGYTTIIAPTGSISMIAGCSSGMEPVYSLVFEKNVKVGSFYYVDPAAEKVLREEGLLNDKLMEDINQHKGSIQRIEYVPERIRKALVTAMDITPEEHIMALASFQKWVDSSISKTNNFPADATLEHMRDSYILAYKLGCKDVTVFRDSSIKDQVLVAPKAKEKKDDESKIDAKPEMKKILKESETGLVFANGNGDAAKPMTKQAIKNCPECGAKVELKEGCLHCPSCGWGLCM
ncbi:hypothetical protein HYY71_05775 [Candidatus Woesearchaeota archaeon]|nr:hypothetical protein [Candidatus Woesearchaeota archaeon]